ncbi:MAG: WG repeat-containing protein, partial [Raineya sp.]|nr:WG repeat-containing protein [Raineya sp.]
LPFVYDDINSYQNGLFLVSIGNKWGVVDATNKPIIPFEYDYIRLSKGSDMHVNLIKGNRCFLGKIEYNSLVIYNP